MKNRIRIYAFLIFSVVSGLLTAQQNLTLYNMHFIPQRTYANPALLPVSKINIGLPVLSSVYFNFGNSGFKIKDVITKRADDSVFFDIDNVLGKMKENNYLYSSFQTDLLSFGFRIKQNYFSFNATEKINFRFRYPSDFINFVYKGNGALLGEELSFNFGLDATHYREYGFGYAREIDDKLTVGGKVKYLYGMENIWTEKSDVTLTTEPNYYEITMKSDIIINTSGLDSMTHDFDANPIGTYLFKLKNKGLGIDLGANYKINDKISASASLVDIGYISWKNGVQNYLSHNPSADFTFKGIDLNEMLRNDSITMDRAFDKLLDSLAKTFEIDSTYDVYKTWLPFQFYLGGSYKVNDNNKAGALFYLERFDKKFRPGFSLSFTTQVKRWLNASVSYSYYNRSFTNVGLGLSLNAGPVQWYVVSDNVLGLLLYDRYISRDTLGNENGSFKIPAYTKNLNIRFGINFTFGREALDKDKDGVPDKKDNCVDIPGLPEFAGCPDKDGDKVIDKNDDCPDEAGLIEFKGCPDKDHDGLIDKIDLCPADSGAVKFNGCPDKDGDGIIDKEDECPAEAGVPQFKGCPDTDQDGIKDALDLCPTKPGPESNNGCPEIILELLDNLNNVVKSAKKSKEDTYVFENLPPDEQVLFRLYGDSTDHILEVKVYVGGLGKVAIRGADKFFRFPILKPDESKLKKEGEQDVAIKLQKEEAEILKKAFDNLEFETGKAIIKPGSYKALDELAGLMAKKPSWRIRISGHTDNQGNPKANLTLSQKRAEAVRDYLIMEGVDKSRFVVKWFGHTKPIANNKTPEGRQKNRRVEMLIIE